MNHRVLIVDDDAHLRQSLSDILRAHGYEPVTAETGSAALESAREQHPAVALIDLRLEDMSGLDVVAELKSIHKHTACILLTGHASQASAIEAINLGVYSYVLKPYNMDQLLLTIRRAQESYTTQTELIATNRRLQTTLEKLQEAQQQLVRQERMAAVGQLAAGIAHEYNNIVAAILLYAEIMLRDSQLAEANHERVTSIYQQGQRAAQLTRQILDFARQGLLQRQELEANALLHSLLPLLQALIPGNITFSWHPAPEAIRLRGDRERIKQTLINLLKNAVEAMPHGGNLALRLERRVFSQEEAPQPELANGEWLAISVQDSGMGIAPDVLPHIFEPFFTTDVTRHSGLGLAQVYGIVKQHDGAITVETTLGEGATFTLYFPTTSTVPQPEARAHIAVGQEQDSRVMVIAPHQMIREALVAALETLEQEVVSFASVKTALTQSDIRLQDVSLLLCDSNALHMAGPAALRNLAAYVPEERFYVLAEDCNELPPPTGLENLKLRCLKKPVDLNKLEEVLGG